ncbi:hypothetical protein RND81_12G072900 [Saponaria officinalis]|uniref:Uncharacterized protein n=1 Tax=Saponaria officinalis TaxID=3572 RepID=A0AAW1H7M7_SAPOF
MWYRRRGLSLTAGRTKVLSEHDIGEFLKTKDFMNIVSLYVTEQEIPVRTQISPRTKRPSVGPVGGDPSSDSSPSVKKPNLRAGLNLNVDPNVDAHPNVNTHPDVTAQSNTWDSFIVRPFTSTYQSCLESSPTLNASTKKKLPVIRSHVRRSPRQHKDSSSSISPLQHASSLAPIHVVPLASLPPQIPQPSKVTKLPETLASRRSLNFVEPEQVKEKQPVTEGIEVVGGKEKLQVRSDQLGVKSEGKQPVTEGSEVVRGKEKLQVRSDQLGVKSEGKQVKQQQGNRKALATNKRKEKAAECESEKSKGKGKEPAAEKSKGKGKKPASEKTKGKGKETASEKKKGKGKETASEKRKIKGKETASEKRKRKGKEISASNTRKRKASETESESESEDQYEDSDNDDELTDTEL